MSIKRAITIGVVGAALAIVGGASGAAHFADAHNNRVLAEDGWTRVLAEDGWTSPAGRIDGRIVTAGDEWIGSPPGGQADGKVITAGHTWGGRPPSGGAGVIVASPAGDEWIGSPPGGGSSSGAALSAQI